MILESYPADTASFLKKQKNRFANPVGYTISQGIEGIFEGLLQGMDSDKVSPFLDNIIRIRAIQDFTPSQAIAFIFLLKKVIRQEMEKDPEFNSGRGNQISDELLALESQIDVLALIAFDIYMKCREKLYEIRANELKNMTFRLLQRANLISNPELNSGQEQDQDLKDSNIVNVK